MKKFAFVFPGQGSQALKMMDGLADLPCVKNTFAEAHALLGLDFWAMLQEETPAEINQTLNTQPLLLTASIATYRAWLTHAADHQPDYVAGHSLGEYSALVASGVLSFASALKLVQQRAQYMQQAVAPDAGAMAAVIGLEDEEVIAVCAAVMEEGNGIVQGVNFNAPGQVVIAGDRLQVEQASVMLKTKGARKIMPLAVSVPSHCLLMRPAAEKLALALAQVTFQAPQIPVVQNVNAQITSAVSALQDGLLKQLSSPVLWSQCIKTLADNDVAGVVECGPGKILSGLTKRIYPAAQLFTLHNYADMLKLSGAWHA